MSEVGVVHLVWVPYGTALLERFVASYRRHPGGMDHALIIVFNGYKDRQELAPFETVLEGVAHQALYLETPQQDLDNYFAAAALLPHATLCFVNSYSQFQDAHWLRKLHQVLCLPDVGLVGATGSWQCAPYFGFTRADYMGHHPGLSVFLHPSETVSWLRGWVQFYRYKRRLTELRRHYPPFPNPHIRTTGFLIARERFLSLRHAPMRTKEDAMRFESGHDSLTLQIQQRGLKTLVVGKDGHPYESDAWPLSQTYRQGTQSNLLITDNRTGEYADANKKMRWELSWRAWGEKAMAADAPSPEIGPIRLVENAPA